MSSQSSNLLSFSPAGNWLIVGRSTEIEDGAVFNLYNLNQKSGQGLETPQILKVPIDG